MCVGEEDEIRPDAFCDSHGAANGACAIAVCVQQADFVAGVEIIELLMDRSLAVVLLGDRGVGWEFTSEALRLSGI